MEEQGCNRSRKCTRGSEEKNHVYNNGHGYGYGYGYQYHHYQLLQNYHRFGYGLGFGYQASSPALLPLPPPSLPLHLPPVPHYHNFGSKSKSHFHKSAPTSSHCQDKRDGGNRQVRVPYYDNKSATKNESWTVARRPDSGGIEGRVINLVANHFRVEFDPSQNFFHYDVEINPNPSKDIARLIKKKLVENHSPMLSGASPVYDGRRTIYSPVEFKHDKLEFYISLPVMSGKTFFTDNRLHKDKIFRVNVKLVSKFNGEALNTYLTSKGNDNDNNNADGNNESSPQLPQEYIHALDIVLRESPTEKCVASGRSFYAASMGGAREIGCGAVALRGFFQSLRPTQQGLALNVDYSVTAFHESIGVVPYLLKSFDFIRDAVENKGRVLRVDERMEVERALKNMRVFVRHRETVQRYRVYGLTEETTDDIWFPDRDGKVLRLVKYYKDHYGYDVEYGNLPCLQISRRKPCYLPMELCVICEGQKFLGKLSDDQTAKILKMGCQRPAERKAIIEGIMEGPFGSTSGNQAREFNLRVTKEMTRVTGRILQPPKLKLGHGGLVRNLTPSRHDRQWNLLDSHVFEGSRVDRWAIISFGGSVDQKSKLPKFISQLSQRCEQLGIFLHKETIVNPIFEPMHVLGNPKLLEAKLRKIHCAASNDLQLLICVMERKHKGYADLKRIAETSIGVVSQCCLYSNFAKHGSQFLANIALKINAKVGGCTVALYNSLPLQMPRLFKLDEPVIFMGADVTHPHPLDDVSPSIAAVVGSVNWPAANKYVSRMKSQTHRQEIIEDLTAMAGEILDDFYEELSELPKRIIFFRDGVSETQFNKVLQEELQSLQQACTLRYPTGFNPPITFVVVQKRHHTRLFPCSGDSNFDINCSGDENVPPGTVVDTVITHPREFDFFLCSHWGVKGTSRPIHYHVLWDDSRFTSDEVQKLVYNLCYTFVRCTKPISLVPPAYYAHLAAYRGRLYIARLDSSSTISRAAPPKTPPLPKLSDKIRKLMFYC